MRTIGGVGRRSVLAGLFAGSSFLFTQSGNLTERGIVAIPHRRFFTTGHYSAYASTFAAIANASLELGVHYDATWMIRPEQFPAGSSLMWVVPRGNVPDPFGVWGYHHIDFGNYDANKQEVPVRPKRISQVGELACYFEWAHTGSSNFNILSECWLTNSPRIDSGNSNNALMEVGILLSTPDLSFHNSGSRIGGPHFNKGVTFDVRLHSGKFVTFAPADGRPIHKGALDWRAAFEFLIVARILTGNEWINGIAFGLEPLREYGVGTHGGMLEVNKIEFQLS